jgi:TRAP-type C4-dicarboxylate transport system substrate-binding protein
MKKILILLLTVVLVLSLSACGDNDGGTEQKVWKYAHTGRNGDELDQYADLVKQYIEEEFDNVTVELFGAEQLGNDEQRMELVLGGGIEFAQVYSLALANIVPEAQVFTIAYALPEDNEQLSYIFREGEAVSYINDLVSDKGLEILDWYPETFSNFTSNKKLGRLEDFNGQTIRAMNNFIDIANVRAFGASPTTITYSEIYSALQLGTADGQTNPLTIINSNNFFEVQKYLLLSNHQCVQDVVITNSGFYNGLTDEEKEKLSNAFMKVNTAALANRTQIADDALEQIKERKPDLEIIDVSEETKAEWKEIVGAAPRKAFVDEIGESGQKVLDLLDSDIERSKGE